MTRLRPDFFAPASAPPPRPGGRIASFFPTRDYGFPGGRGTHRLSARAEPEDAEGAAGAPADLERGRENHRPRGEESVEVEPALDAAHFASTGATSFARGLNDAPKMAALLMAAPEADATVAIVTVALAMALGGLAGGRGVAETLGRRVTAMDPGQGFAASLATAGLVTTASLRALPVSTTYVSVGAMAGIGATTRQAHWRKIGEIAVAWWAIRLVASSNP